MNKYISKNKHKIPTNNISIMTNQNKQYDRKMEGNVESLQGYLNFIPLLFAKLTEYSKMKLL